MLGALAGDAETVSDQRPAVSVFAGAVDCSVEGAFGVVDLLVGCADPVQGVNGASGDQRLGAVPLPRVERRAAQEGQSRTEPRRTAAPSVQCGRACGSVA